MEGSTGPVSFTVAVDGLVGSRHAGQLLQARDKKPEAKQLINRQQHLQPDHWAGSQAHRSLGRTVARRGNVETCGGDAQKGGQPATSEQQSADDAPARRSDKRYRGEPRAGAAESMSAAVPEVVTR